MVAKHQYLSMASCDVAIFYELPYKRLPVDYMIDYHCHFRHHHHRYSYCYRYGIVIVTLSLSLRYRCRYRYRFVIVIFVTTNAATMLISLSRWPM